jgi:hypothetical protein
MNSLKPPCSTSPGGISLEAAEALDALDNNDELAGLEDKGGGDEVTEIEVLETFAELGRIDALEELEMSAGAMELDWLAEPPPLHPAIDKHSAIHDIKFMFFMGNPNLLLQQKAGYYCLDGI